MHRPLLACVVIAILASTAASSDYYVDPTAGSDGNPGTRLAPWATVGHAADVIAAGDVVNLLPGNHGDIGFNGVYDHWGTSWDAPVTYRADPDSPPGSVVVSRITVTGYAKNLYVRFEGLEVYNTTYSTGISLQNANHAQFIDCTVHGASHTGGGGCSSWAIYIHDSSDVLVEGCEVYHTGYFGISIDGSTDVTVRDCHVHDIPASGIRAGAGSSDILIEYNYVHHQRPEWSPGAHGTGISMRCSNATVRGNIVHDFGNTRPIRWYHAVAGPLGYSNLLVENNLCYDNYAYPTEFVDMGSNCIIRNNTFEGCRIWFAEDVDGSGLSLHNNVIVGNLLLNNYGTTTTLKKQTRAEASVKWANINQGHNIARSASGSGNGYVINFGQIAPGDTNLILTNDSGNFKPGYDDSFFDVGSFFVATSGPYPYQLAPDSPAIGFGDAANAPTQDLLEATRDAAPDAGPYEYGVPAVPGDADGDGDVDMDDFVALKQNFATPSGATQADGDFDGDGDVDMDDFVLLKQNFGT